MESLQQFENASTIMLLKGTIFFHWIKRSISKLPQDEVSFVQLSIGSQSICMGKMRQGNGQEVLFEV